MKTTKKNVFDFPSAIGPLRIRLIAPGDEEYFLQFAQSLGAESRELFAPYQWGTNGQKKDFQDAIAGCEAGKDLSYLMFSPPGIPVGHLALWGVERQHSLGGRNVRIPTLGICMADAFQGKGLGRIGVKFLQDRALKSGADAIELTFAPWNKRGEKLYRSLGFEDIGMLRIPLGINPATPDVDMRGVKTWREERHQVYIINPTPETAIKSYLRSKQKS